MGSVDAFLKSLDAGPIALDTAIFIYHLEDRSPYSDLTTVLFEAVERDSIQLRTSVLTITEVLTGYRRMRDFKSEMAFLEMIRQFSHTLNIVPIDMLIADRASYLRAKYSLRTPDALHLATAWTVDAKRYLTNDRKLKSIEEISVVVLSDFAQRK